MKIIWIEEKLLTNKVESYAVFATAEELVILEHAPTKTETALLEYDITPLPGAFTQTKTC